MKKMLEAITKGSEVIKKRLEIIIPQLEATKKGSEVIKKRLEVMKKALEDNL